MAELVQSDLFGDWGQFADTTRHEEMVAQLRAFDASHPEVWREFCRVTRELIARGYKRYSARGVFQIIRWETGHAKVDKRVEFKMNDHFSPFYARRFMAENPQHDGFFEKRQQKSKETKATGLPPLGPQDYAPEAPTWAPKLTREERSCYWPRSSREKAMPEYKTPEWYDESKLFRLRFVHENNIGESVWAVDLGDGTCRLANDPLIRGLGWGDRIRKPSGDIGAYDFEMVEKYDPKADEIEGGRGDG